MPRHANERVYIGPKTNELILTLGRVHQSDIVADGMDVTLEVTRRNRVQELTSIWMAYTVDENGCAHFEIPIDFLVEEKKGFYDAELMLNDCEICRLEIVKAPSIHIKSAQTANSECAKTAWVEPSCTPQEKNTNCPCPCKGDVEQDCSCINKPGGSCVSCKREVFVAEADLSCDYSDVSML